MSNTPQGMLPGDEFSLKDWTASQGSPKSNGVMTVEIEEAFSALNKLTTAAGIPMFTVFATGNGLVTVGDLGSKPENVPAEMLMARAMLSNNPEHVMHIAMAQMQGMKP